IVRKDYGAAIANEVARRLVIAPHREGGQAQFVPEPIAPSDTGSPPAPGLASAPGLAGGAVPGGGAAHPWGADLGSTAGATRGNARTDLLPAIPRADRQ